MNIFDSEAGQLILSYAWRRFGRRAQIHKMSVYVIFVVFATLDVLTFESLHRRTPVASIVFMAIQLAIDAFFVREEAAQFLLDPIDYLSDIWNQIDFTVIIGSIVSIVLRLVYWDDTNASRVTYSITIIATWFNVLYYLRAFESTGPLVSMILKISGDMQYLILVVMFVIMGFSQVK